MTISQNVFYNVTLLTTLARSMGLKILPNKTYPCFCVWILKTWKSEKGIQTVSVDLVTFCINHRARVQTKNTKPLRSDIKTRKINKTTAGS